MGPPELANLIDPFSPVLRYYVYMAKVMGYRVRTDWPKLGPSLMIATALVLAIRTAKWPTRKPIEDGLSDVDVDLDAEVAFSIRLTKRVFDALLHKHEALFPQVREPIHEPLDEDIMK